MDKIRDKGHRQNTREPGITFRNLAQKHPRLTLREELAGYPELLTAAAQIMRSVYAFEKELFARHPRFRRIANRIKFNRIIFLPPGGNRTRESALMGVNAASELEIEARAHAVIMKYFRYLFGHEVGHKIFRRQCLEASLSTAAKERVDGEFRGHNNAFDGVVVGEIIGEGLAHPLFKKIKVSFGDRLLDELDEAYGWGDTFPPHVVACLEVMASRVSYLIAPDKAVWGNSFAEYESAKLEEYKRDFPERRSSDMEILISAAILVKIGKPETADAFAARFDFEFAGAKFRKAFNTFYREVLGRFWDAVELLD